MEKDRVRKRKSYKVRERKRNLESSIATNELNRVRVLDELERLTQEISDQIALTQYRQEYSILPQE